MEVNFQTCVTVSAGLVALALIVKPLYVRYVRKDVPVDLERIPVLKALATWPVHASHRGGARVWPENTLLAFRNAVTCRKEGAEDKEGGDTGNTIKGTQVLELDVQRTADGELVVCHDLVLDTTTNGTGVLQQKTWAEISTLDAAYHFTRDGGFTHPYRSQGLHIPRLKEVLQELSQVQHLVFYLDLKTVEVVEPALQMVHLFNLQHRVIMGAVPEHVNKKLLEMRPPYIPMTPDEKTMIFLFLCHHMRLLWLVPLRHEIVGSTVQRWGLKIMTARFVKAFHERRRLVAVFGPDLDSADVQAQCMDIGCDFLFCDRPDILVSTLNAWRRRVADPSFTPHGRPLFANSSEPSKPSIQSS